MIVVCGIQGAKYSRYCWEARAMWVLRVLLVCDADAGVSGMRAYAGVLVVCENVSWKPDSIIKSYVRNVNWKPWPNIRKVAYICILKTNMCYFDVIVMRTDI